MLKQIRVTSPYGYRIHPITGVSQLHGGVDLMANYEPLSAYADGRVIRVDTSEVTGYGQYIIIDHGNYRTLYAHLSNVKVFRGQEVKRGQQIAITGNSGMSTAPHLHFEIIIAGKRVDPMMFSEIQEVEVELDEIILDAVYRYEDQKIYVELRQLAELLGHEVEWTPKRTEIKKNATNQQKLAEIMQELTVLYNTL